MTDMIPAWVNGTLTPEEKLEAHQKGIRHKAISVFLMRGDKVLLQRRAMGKYHTPGLWANTCCTHPHWGETPMDCATRRLGQELGLFDVALQFRDTVEYRADVGGGLIEHEVVDIFVGELPAGREPVPDPTEVMDTIWQPLPELMQAVVESPAGFTPWLRIYLRDHAGVIFQDA
jgi:isopentenyl-diphosphate delta-isomerase